MTTQTELDADLLAVLDQHLATRRELLKWVKGEVLGLAPRPTIEGRYIHRDDINSLFDRLIEEAKLP